jgi:hypothetical protein
VLSLKMSRRRFALGTVLTALEQLAFHPRGLLDLEFQRACENENFNRKGLSIGQILSKWWHLHSLALCSKVYVKGHLWKATQEWTAEAANIT